MKPIFKRLIASLLIALLFMSELTPLAHASAGNETGVGTGGDSSSGGTGSGSFSVNSGQCGYRMYFIDADGNRVSNKVDIVFSNKRPPDRGPFGIQNGWMQGTGVWRPATGERWAVVAGGMQGGVSGVFRSIAIIIAVAVMLRISSRGRCCEAGGAGRHEKAGGRTLPGCNF